MSFWYISWANTLGLSGLEQILEAGRRGQETWRGLATWDLINQPMPQLWLPLDFMIWNKMRRFGGKRWEGRGVRAKRRSLFMGLQNFEGKITRGKVLSNWTRSTHQVQHGFWTKWMCFDIMMISKHMVAQVILHRKKANLDGCTRAGWQLDWGKVIGKDNKRFDIMMIWDIFHGCQGRFVLRENKSRDAVGWAGWQIG